MQCFILGKKDKSGICKSKMKRKWRIYPFGAFCRYCYNQGIRKHVFMLDEEYGYCRKCIRECKHKSLIHGLKE